MDTLPFRVVKINYHNHGVNYDFGLLLECLDPDSATTVQLSQGVTEGF